MPDEYLKELISKICDDIDLIRANQDKQADKSDRFNQKVTSFMATSSEDRKLLRQTVGDLQSKVDKLASILGVHKKKGLWALVVAMFSGAAIASGTLNYQKIIESILGMFHAGR